MKLWSIFLYKNIFFEILKCCGLFFKLLNVDSKTGTVVKTHSNYEHMNIEQFGCLLILCCFFLFFYKPKTSFWTFEEKYEPLNNIENNQSYVFFLFATWYVELLKTRPMTIWRFCLNCVNEHLKLWNIEMLKLWTTVRWYCFFIYSN